MKSLALPSLLILTALATPLQSAVISYHRFGNNPDDPGSLTAATTGTNLTNSNVSAVTLPGSGAGSDFLNPIDGQTNTRAAQFDASGDRLTGASGTLGLGSDFTIESLAHLTSYSTSTRIIASQWVTTGNQRSWFFGVGTDERLRLTLSGDGSTSTVFDSGLTFSLNTDYYVGAVFNSGTVTFYLQNLTSGGALQSVNISPGGAPTSAFNSTGSFQIGNFNTGTNADQVWLGLLDEVRLSDTALTADQLLVPEPGVATLLIGAGLVLLMRRRGRVLA